MKVKLVDEAITTNSAGQVVEAVPVYISDTPVAGHAPVTLEPDDVGGVPVVIVDSLTPDNLIGEPVDALVVESGGGWALPISNGVRALTTPSLHQYAEWLGEYPDHKMLFCDASTWALAQSRLEGSITALADQWGGYTEQPQQIEWVFPLCTSTQALSQTTAGTHDAIITAMFEAIEANRPTGELWIRLGWEFNITAYPWNIVAANTAQQYIDAFQHVVNLARAVSDRFQFTWCVNWAAQNPEPAYPGDSYVDVIGMDAYFKTQFDQSSGQTGNQVWEYKRDATYGIQWMVDFAETHGKRWALCEWGGNADEPDWMQGQVDYIAVNRPKYHGYWDQTTPSDANCKISNGAYPNMGAVYIEAFGNPLADRAWNPLLYFKTDLVDWYDATHLSSFKITGGNVEQWTSEIGPKAVEQSNASNRPAYSATARNGLPGVTFDGTSDVLVGTDISNVPLGQEAVSYGLQLYGAADVAQFRYMISDTNTVPNQRMIGAGGSGLPTRLQSTGNMSATSSGLANTDRSVHASIPAGATPTVSMAVDGKTPNTAAVGIPAYTPTKKVIGGNGASSDGVGSFFKGTLQEAITVKRELTSDEINKLHGYLAHKWKGSRGAIALPAGHPYEFSPPTL
jgi:hypothetical protein